MYSVHQGESVVKSPLIIINFKTYNEGFGNNAHQIAHSAEIVGQESGVTIGVAPNYMELHPISMHYAIPVYAQHVDGIEPGASTGHILPEAVKLAGASGTLINHSERRLTLAGVGASVKAAKRANLQTIVCTNNTATSAAAAVFLPDYVAIEPPELIGTGVSVKVLAGAGINSGECVKTAVDLGTDGVLLASGVVKARDPVEILRDLVSLL